MDIKLIQACLKRKGFDPGPIDGIDGPQTRRAIVEYKQSQGLRARPYIGPITYKRLTGQDLPKTGSSKHKLPDNVPPWINEAYKWLGVHESDDALEAWLKSDGRTVGDPDDIPWCGDMFQTAISRVLPNEPWEGAVGKNPFLALNWSKDFGDVLEEACYGCIGSFWRENPKSWKGHLAAIVGYDPVRKRYRILGGNQNDRVTLTWIDAKRLRKNGLRWPSTYDGPKLPVPIMNSAGAVLSRNEA